MNKKIVDYTNLPIIGAICGDILGSSYEWNRTKDINCPICRSEDRFTDDTVCTIAVTEAIIYDTSIADALVKWCRRYRHAGYGPAFRQWFISDVRKPYNSWGNGAAMRASAAGALANSLEEALSLAVESAMPTHNHPEGIKGAKATAAAIYLARTGAKKKEIKRYLKQTMGYNLDRSYSDIQRRYLFDVSCQGSVPESIICFLESSSYEDAVRRAIAMGGDADTMACICGGIAAAFYGYIPDDILDHCVGLLPNDMKRILSASILCNHKPVIIYVHGFMSGGESLTAKRLRELYGDKYQIIAPEFTADPVESILKLDSVIRHYSPVAIVGTSLGGFYALMCESGNIPVFVVNPVVSPVEQMGHWLDDEQTYFCTRQDGAKRYTLDEKTLSKFSRFDVMSVISSKSQYVYAICSTKDELLDDSHIRCLTPIIGESHISISDTFGHRISGMGAESLKRIIDSIITKS